MTSENRNIAAQLLGYVARSRHYLENAYASLEQGEVEKAGEFLWGSMAQAVKAVAAFKGVDLPRHGDIWNYVATLSRGISDQAMLDAFKEANSLHQNFYESGLTSEIVFDHGERIRPAIGRLLRLIPREILEQ